MTILLLISGIVTALTTVGVVATLLLRRYSIERAVAMFIMGGILSVLQLIMCAK